MLRKRCVIWETCLLVFGVLFAFYLWAVITVDSGEVNEERMKAENERKKDRRKGGGRNR